MPRTRISSAIQRQQAADPSEELDAASQRTPYRLLNKERRSSGKSVPRGDSTRRASMEPQATPSLVDVGDRASRRASCGDLGPAPRSTTRCGAALTPVLESSVHQASFIHLQSQQGVRLKLTHQAMQEPQKSSGSRYFAEMVRRRQVQLTIDSAAAKTDGTRPASPAAASSAENRASPRDLLPRSPTRRSSVSSSHSSTSSATAQHTSTERHGMLATPPSNPGRQQKPSSGSRYSAELVRRRSETPKNVTTDIDAPLVVTRTESTVIASSLSTLFFGLISLSMVGAVGLVVILTKNVFATCCSEP